MCQLRWNWEVKVDDRGTPVFVLPEAFTKTGTERAAVLNTIARQVVESARGEHEDFVFCYRGEPLGKLRTSAWTPAWKKAGLPTETGILKGVHNLRHTFGRRQGVRVFPWRPARRSWDMAMAISRRITLRRLSCTNC